MKKSILLFLLCIVLIIIGVCVYFVINNNETFNISAEEYFNVNNEENEISADNLNMFSSPKPAEGGAFGQVTRTLKEGTITNSGATIILTNRTNVKFNYMPWLTIEKKVNNEWIEVTPKDNNNISSGLDIIPNTSVEVYLDWSKYYGTLEKRRV